MKHDDGKRGHQYGPCKPLRKQQPKMPVPTERDRELALRDLNEVGWTGAREFTRYVIEYDENPFSAATKQAFRELMN